jgi:adenylate cyclase
MESHGEAGQIQLSEITRDLLAPRFVLRERGVITVKGKGDMRTWFLESSK